MSRFRRSFALVLLLVSAGLLLSGIRGQAPPEKPEKKWLLDRDLTVSPAPAPVPAMKYRLFPMTSERKAGNAVPIYLRFAHERNDAWRKQLREKPMGWNKLPLEKLPLAEVKVFLDGHRYNLEQLALGARRRTADWEYTLDLGDPIGIRLPDTHDMRMHASLLVLEARVKCAEGRFADAVRTLQTGFSFSQQLSEGPFLINGLVGIACATQLTDHLSELIERAGAPNLYWALAVIPRPLIDLRKANEVEQGLLELQFPDMAELDRPRSTEEWDAALRRVREEFARVTKTEANAKPTKPGNAPTDPASKSPDLPEARKYLVEVVGMKPDRLDEMPPARVLLLYLSHYYHDLRDEVFKASYLPFPQALLLFAESDKRMKSMPDTEAARLTGVFLPAHSKVLLAQVRVERKLTAWRAIEALRMHAAANGGRLPDKLDQVTVVPVPNDPGTGRPFEYQREGETATLVSRIPGQPQEATGLRYRVKVRK